MSVSFIEKFVFSWEIVVGSFLKVSQLRLKKKQNVAMLSLVVWLLKYGKK